MTHTRPDICFSVGFLARFMQNPNEQLLKAVKGVFKYLKGTKDYSIVYKGSKKPELIGYSDSDYGGDYETRKSIYSYLFTLNNAPIS